MKQRNDLRDKIKKMKWNTTEYRNTYRELWMYDALLAARLDP